MSGGCEGVRPRSEGAHGVAECEGVRCVCCIQLVVSHLIYTVSPPHI